MKRFWTTATTDGATIALDGKPVRTPRRNPLLLPTPALAEAITAEWNAVGETIDPRAMPLTGLANAAIDIVAPDPAGFAATLAAYGESDALCYGADRPSALVAAQQGAWTPLLDWARARYDIAIETTSGIIHRPQPAATLARLAEAATARDPFALAGLAPIVTIGGSLIAALALTESAFDADTVWAATALEELWQETQWGADAEAEAARAVKRAEFDAAVRFLGLLH